eukprot:tig00021348_g20605.t1
MTSVTTKDILTCYDAYNCGTAFNGITGSSLGSVASQDACWAQANGMSVLVESYNGNGGFNTRCDESTKGTCYSNYNAGGNSMGIVKDQQTCWSLNGKSFTNKQMVYDQATSTQEAKLVNVNEPSGTCYKSTTGSGITSSDPNAGKDQLSCFHSMTSKGCSFVPNANTSTVKVNEQCGTCYSTSTCDAGTELSVSGDPTSGNCMNTTGASGFKSAATNSCTSLLKKVAPLMLDEEGQAFADEGAFDVELDALDADLLTDAFAAEAEFADAE